MAWREIHRLLELSEMQIREARPGGRSARENGRRMPRLRQGRTHRAPRPLRPFLLVLELSRLQICDKGEADRAKVLGMRLAHDGGDKNDPRALFQQSQIGR